MKSKHKRLQALEQKPRRGPLSIETATDAELLEMIGITEAEATDAVLEQIAAGVGV